MTPLGLKLRNGNRVTEADIEMIERAAVNPRLLAAHEDIVREGDKPGNVRLILSGVAFRYKLLAGGKRSIMAFLLPGDFCDLHISILGRMDHAIAALTACTVVDIPHRDIELFLESNARLAKALWWATLVDEAILREWLANVGQRSADKKLAHLICEFRLRLQVIGMATRQTLQLPMTQEELGDTLGITSVHVNRVFQQLKQDGLVVAQGRDISIPDLLRLEKFAEFTPGYLHLQDGA